MVNLATCSHLAARVPADAARSCQIACKTLVELGTTRLHYPLAEVRGLVLDADGSGHVTHYSYTQLDGTVLVDTGC